MRPVTLLFFILHLCFPVLVSCILTSHQIQPGLTARLAAPIRGSNPPLSASAFGGNEWTWPHPVESVLPASVGAASHQPIRPPSRVGIVDRHSPSSLWGKFLWTCSGRLLGEEARQRWSEDGEERWGGPGHAKTSLRHPVTPSTNPPTTLTRSIHISRAPMLEMIWRNSGEFVNQL